MYIDASSQVAGARARIQSASVSVASEDLCVKFWYYMYGGNVGSLKVYYHEAFKDTLTWIKKGTWGPQWNYAQIYITGNNNIEIIFEAVRENKWAGVIALDDISFNTGPCPSARDCDFENGQCGFSKDASSDLDWTLGSGQATPSGPSTDHSYGTQYGHYMYFATSVTSPQTIKARLDSPVYPPSAHCLRFWYYMSGSGIPFLRVFLRRQNAFTHPIWSTEGHQDTEWHAAQVDINSPVAFQVTFEGIVNPEVLGDIAIDDISLLEGPCLPLGYCDFEDDTCTWKNALDYDQFDWKRHSGQTQSESTGPKVDHTLGTVFGTYLLMDASAHCVQGDRAWLLSPFIDSSIMHCVTFWYHMLGSDVGNLTLKQQWADRPAIDLWTKTGNQSDEWLPGFTLMSDEGKGKYRIIFEGVVGNGPVGTIAIDDIVIESGAFCLVEPSSSPSCQFQCGGAWGECVTLSQVCDFMIDCENGADEDFCGYDCTFEGDAGLCGWGDESHGPYQWQRGKGTTADANTGPTTDHTTLTSLGYYVYVDASFGSEGSYAVLRTPNLRQASATCQLIFWYHIYGSGIGTLKVAHLVGSRETRLWRISGSQGELWHRAVVPLGRLVQDFHIAFEATRTFSVLGDIAIDDITFENCALPAYHIHCREGQFRCGRGSCVNTDRLCDFTDDCGDSTDERMCDAYPGRCDFEAGLCDWVQLNDELSWTVGRGGIEPAVAFGPDRDHTTGMSTGYFLFIDTRYPHQNGQHAKLGSPLLTSGPECQLRFYYYMSGDSVGAIRVYLRTSLGGPLELLWERQDKGGAYYERAEVSVFRRRPFQVIIEGSVGNEAGHVIAIDDASFSSDCWLYEGQLPSGSTLAPTTESPCSTNQFRCGHNECIPVSQYCDGVMNCIDGLDEATCGMCTFEERRCGWRDDSTGDHAWSRQQGLTATGTAPNADHTTGTAMGWYMLVDLSTGVFESEALLQSPVLGEAASSCTVSFWYYMPGFEGSSLSLFIVDKDEREIWSYTAGGENQWNQALARIGRQKFGYKLLFKAWTMPVAGDVALDDITMNNCYLPPPRTCMGGEFQCVRGSCVPDDSVCDFTDQCGDRSDENDCSTYERCDFEHDYCNMTHSEDSQTTWNRRNGLTNNVGPTFDHLGNRTAHYLSLSDQGGDHPSAGLRSIVFLPTNTGQTCQVKCYYHFGRLSGALNIGIRTHFDGDVREIWKQNVAQQEQWKRVVVTINSTEKFEVVIQGRIFAVDGPSETLAIDDISFSKGCVPASDAALSCREGFGACNSQCIPNIKFCNFIQDCPPDRADEDSCPDVCDFESDQCGWNSEEPTEQISWQRMKAGDSAVDGTAPLKDHSLNSTEGHYIWVGVNNITYNTTTFLKSSIYHSSGLNCSFHFYYNIAGCSILSVWLHTAEEAQLLFKTHSATQNQWLGKEVKFPTCLQEFQVVFEGTIQSPTGFLALDSFKFSNCGVMEVPVCPVEMFACRTGSCIPNSSVCDYQVDCCDGADEEPQTCSKYTMCNFESNLCSWEQLSSDNADWIRQEGQPSTQPGIPHTDHTTGAHNGSFLYLTANTQSDPEVLAQLGSPVIQKQSLTSPICKVRFWYQLSEGAKLMIFTRTALGGDLRMTDDIINRTSNIWEKAEITIEPTAMETLIPFQIILQAYVSLGNASVAVDDISITPACTTAEVLLPDTTTEHKDYGQIVFLTKNLPNQIGLAIDNSGRAFTANVTDNIASVFNLYSPGLYQNISETVSFKSVLNESYYLQHSRNELGREVELFIKQIQSSNKDTAPASFWLAKNKWFPGFDALEAVSLPGYYIRHAGSRVFVAMDDGTGTFKEDASWKLRAVNISTTAPPTPQCPPTFFPCDTGECIPAKKCCDFTADCPSGEDEADCAATCDFEADACGWYENAPGDGFDWRRSSQITVPPEYQSQAPPQDHSTNTTEGHFMFALKNSSRFSQIAELRSPRFSQSASGCTMSFWHYNYGRAVGAADMNLQVEGENGSTTVIWRTLYNQGDQWLQAVIQLGRLTQPFHFSLTKVSLGVFDGVSALDDIYFENCSLPPPAASCEDRDKFHCRDTKACIGRLLVCDLVDDCGDGSDEDHCLMDLQCNFENGLCSWTQDTADSFNWTRIQGPTPTSKTGPWKDHTLGTVNGHYLYIEASDQNFQDTAVLLSQTFDSTISNDKKPCIFRFYYHMFGQHIYKLSVFKRSSTETKGELLWIKYGEQSNIWLRETLYLTSHQPFQILVEGTVGDDFNGDIGIDDLSFMDCVPYNGELPPTAPTTPSGTSNPITAHPHNCTVNQFVCRATGHCIDLMNRCDFRDDCSDKSDELNCVHPMCDFEGGNMYGWYQNVMTISSKVEHAFQWFTGQGSTLHPGEENHRPTTDHTLGTPQGWYMYADSSNGEFGQIADLMTPVISQTGPQCKLVFWYHMNGVTVGSLQVFSKFGNVTHEVWSQSGSQGNKWRRGEVILGIRYNFEIILRGKRGVSYIGDVVVDDISFENCAPLLIPDRQCTANEFACANKYCIPKDSLCDFKNDCGDASDENPFICRTFQGRCDFEFDFCSWRQWHNDDFDWLLKAGSTPTIGSGPPTDHTLRETSGHYIYIKSTLPQAPGNKARISGPTISKNSKECKIIFYFHVAGNGIGTLNVYQVTISDQYLLLLNLTGDQGNYWQRRELLLHAEEDFVVMFEGQAGKGVKQLISVDDILFTRECLLASSSGPTEPTSHPPSGSCPHGYLECQNGKCYRPEQSCDFVNDCEDNTDEEECGTSCNFEGGRCGWRNSLADNFDWILGEGSTKSLRPPIDHTLGDETGHFVYLEASSDGLKGDTSHMKSSKWKESRATCKLAFWYYFSATATGLIRLLVKTERGLTELWNMTGNQGGQWNRAEVPLRKMRNFEVIFEGIRAKDFGGGAAIDDIEFVNCVPSGELPGSCPAVTDYVCRNGKCIESHLICDSKPDCEDESDETDCSGILSIPGACNFNMAETESWEAQCLLEQNMNDDFDWSIGRSSVAEGTGPSSDHSKDGKGRYIYINSGAQIEGDIAILTTHLSYPASLGVCRVRFWYHMYGSRHMGTLKVYTVGESGISLLMWYVNGYQGNTWNYANVIVSNHSPFRVAFAAEVGGDSLTDIALDDISFTPECEVGGPITPQPLTCSPDSFQCQYVYECIPLTWLCDWEPDCVDESDESNCPTKNPGTLPPQDLCGDSQFQCSNEQCLPSLLRCDGVADCPSAEDEFSCPCKLCLNGSLLCEDTGRCMPASQRCNGIVDCNQFQPDESSCTECPSEYCMNGGTCFINMEGPMCQCKQEWRGNRCNLKEKAIPTPSSTPYHENGSVGIFAGLGAGLILLVTGIAAVLLFVYRRKMLPQKPTEVGYGIMENSVYGGFEDKSEFSMSDAVPGVNVSVYPWLEEHQEEPGNKTHTAHSFANPLYVSSAGDVKPTA
ncbi:MAM and LDL-receptor class A domain-containing protein 1 [Acipenser oxyrinchus oxyrinchus]|uniref:MAM and LDL-receptor class A domain-containing protein 1 n=1 Tax=Acipenser oxyrinchus oxyrinchus TaxID=40147 RepID=A0AAD8GD92_ACIOX|nr:MAM and LDL-receptor class A domain-containing protein 1 [Acipenser oxyrinchus oxyrinchus]